MYGFVVGLYGNAVDLYGSAVLQVQGPVEAGVGSGEVEGQEVHVMEDQAAEAGLEALGLQEAHVEQLAPVEEESRRLLHQEEAVMEALGEAPHWIGMEGRCHTLANK